VWRLATSFLWLPLNFSYLTVLYFLYNYAMQLETSLFAGRRADMVFFLAFEAATILPLAVMFRRLVLLESLVTALVYVWAMANRHAEVSFFFGLRFKAMYLPWVWLIFDFLSGSSDPTGKLLGIAAGHLYYFLDRVYPEQTGGRRLLVTPAFVARAFPEPDAQGTAAGGGGGGAGDGFGGGVHVMRPRQTAEQERQEGLRNRTGYAWGRGNRLAD
ncbi:Derlin 1, partial [Cladochytrium tenue]